MIFDAVIGLALQLVMWFVSLIPTLDIPPLDFGPAVGMMLIFDGGFPVHETLLAITAFVIIDVSLFLFDAFDWGWKKIPVLGGS